jgi:hypothetical protein
MMKRITVDEVRAAYEKTGLTPVRGNFCTYSTSQLRDYWTQTELGIEVKLTYDCGCALTACCRAEDKPFPEDVEHAASELDLDESYASGFINGFDGVVLCPEDVDGPVAYEAGYADGVAAAKAVFA